MDSKENGKTAREPQLDLIRGNPPALEVSSATVQASNTQVDIAMTGISLTPGPGNYVALLSANFDLSGAGSDDQVTVSLYLDGMQVAGTERTSDIYNNNDRSIATQVLLSGVTAGQVLDTRWRTQDGRTVNLRERSLILIKVR